MECDGQVARLNGDLHHYSFPNLATQIAKINPFADLFVRQQQERGRRFSAPNAIGRAVWRFFRGYVLKAGFLDGYPGLYVATINAFAVFARHARVYEVERGCPPPADS
jgi:hypothetical protein